MDAGLAVVPLSRPEWLDRMRRFEQAHGSLDEALGPLADPASWHDARARDAEEEGDRVMALHHLDQLLQRRPDDGNALLRRMHQRLIAEDFLRATEDMRRAEGLLGKTQVSLWRRHHESLSLFREQTGPACWYAAGNREETRPAPK